MPVEPKWKAHEDPIGFCSVMWPDVYLYDKQRAILMSIVENDETYVPAANKMGKDFVAGIVVLWYFLTRTPCRIVTTSAKADHLSVLWGEIGNRITTAKYPLLLEDGGPLRYTNQHLQKLVKDANGERLCDISYVKSMVASPDSIAAMGGHHVANIGDGIPKTMFLADEASSVPSSYYEVAYPWFNVTGRAYIFGNTWDCDNFFKESMKGRPGTTDKGGDIPRPNGKGFERKVIRIKAEDSPNVQYGLAQKRAGIEPTNEVLVQGVKSYAEYEKDRRRLDAYRQCVCLDADFYEGKENKLFPPTWLSRAETIAETLRGRKRTARAMGIDTAAGGDNTAWVLVDEFGIIECVSMKTPNTAMITGRTIALAKEWGLIDKPQQWLFDQGGGGKEHADRLRDQGYDVRTIHFGEGATPADRMKRTYAYRSRKAKVDDAEVAQIYKNRRAEMYHLIRQLVDPENDGWGIPREFGDIHTQLSVIPLLYDNEGTLYLPPKQRASDAKEGTGKITMYDLLGRSPDEADALALAVYGMSNRTTPVVAGAL